MSEKNLSDREWKAFSRNASYKAEPMLKALAALDKARRTGLAEQLEALTSVEREAATLVRANSTDKALAVYLGELGKSAKARRKEVQAGQEEEKALDHDNPEVQALLDPRKLLDQLSQCKRDPERTVQFGFTDGHDKQPALLAMHPRISGRKLFALLQDKSGIKTGAYGSAWIDGTSLMLQLDKPMSGLVKKIRSPVKACGFRITMAVLWNDDGTVFEQEKLDDDPMPSQASHSSASSGGGEQFKARLARLLPGIKASASTPTAQAIERLVNEAGDLARKQTYDRAMAVLDEVEKTLGRLGAGKASPSDPAQDFNNRLAALLPKVQSMKTAGHPAAKDVTLKFSEAGAVARKQDFRAAAKLLDEAEALMNAQGNAPTAGKALPLWTRGQDAVSEQIAMLQARLRDTGHPVAQAIADRGLGAITERLQVGLKTALIELDTATTPQARTEAAAKARKGVAALRDFAQTHPALPKLDANPFGVSVNIRATLRQTIESLEKALNA